MSWWCHRRRGSAALEAALALPVMLVVFGAVAQVMILSQSRVHVEHAAYAAARAALVHKCPAPSLGTIVRGKPCKDDPQKWEDAARWALVAAGATSWPDCNLNPTGQQLLTATGKIEGRDKAARNAVCYAYAPENVRVTVDWDRSLIAQILGQTEFPITATVTFRYPLSTPFRRFLTAKRDGRYYIEHSATVTLL